MRLTTRGRYAVTAMLDLALNIEKSPVTLAEIADRQGISQSYLEQLFSKLRKDKRFLSERDHHFKTYIGVPTPFIKLENLTNYLGGAQIYAKVVSEANGGAHKIYNATVHCLIARRAGLRQIVGDTRRWLRW